MRKPIAFFVAALSFVSPFAEYGLNIPQGVTQLSHDIYDLHMMVFWICVGIAVIVFGAMFYSIFAHRQSKGVKAANFHESTSVEMIWTAIPIIILVLMAIPASQVLIDLEDTSKAEMSVKVTGHQWKWQYDYPKEGISFISNLKQSSKDVIYATDAERQAVDAKDRYLLSVDKPLVLPVDTNIRFLITANDVIHNWWVPAFGIKQDANPGFINDAWAKIDEIGTYRGQCAELCGKHHAFMPVVVEVVSKADYKIWVDKQLSAKAQVAAQSAKTWSKKALMAQGKKVYNASCAACHGATGAGIPGAFPAIKGSPIANGPISAHINMVLNGKAGTAMQAFKKQLNDADLASVITYQRNALGNKVGDLVQPTQIKATR